MNRAFVSFRAGVLQAVAALPQWLGLALLLCPVGAGPAVAQELALGANLEGLMTVARNSNPELAAMRYEAVAAEQRVISAGALPDPRFRTELRDITRMGEQNPTLVPNQVGSTRYLLMQDLPWFGKRDLKREIAGLEAQGATGRTLVTWSEVAARIKTAFAQWYFLDRSERLSQEVLELMGRLEKVALARYEGGLAAQQDVIRAQVEQTNVRSELVGLNSERAQVQARLNALLGRPATAPLAPPQSLRPPLSAAQLDQAELERRAIAANPLLQADSARVDAAGKSRDLAYKNRYPDFTVGISPIQTQSRVREWEVMFELNIPLQLDSRRAQERESEAMLSAASARREATASRLRSELSENLSALQAARQAGSIASDSLLPQSELNFRSALAGYENGRVDFATLLEAQRQIRQAKQTRIRAQVEEQARLAEIERIVGEDL